MDRTSPGPIIFASPVAARSALESLDLTPPDAPNSLRPGPTADLRAAMARFSRPDVHSERRASVLEAVASIDDRLLASVATKRSKTVLERGRGEQKAADAGQFDLIADLAFVVPVETLGAAMGTAESELPTIRADVRAIVDVIGRQQPSGEVSDAAARRLVTRFDEGTVDTVAAISLLYQTHDATAALFAATVLAEQTAAGRRPALAKTTRVAMRATMIGATDVHQGAAVVIDLERSGHEFGAGPHECPGRHLAEQIVTGMMVAVRAEGCQVDHDRVDHQDDGRPRTLPVIHHR